MKIQGLASIKNGILGHSAIAEMAIFVEFVAVAHTTARTLIHFILDGSRVSVAQDSLLQADLKVYGLWGSAGEQIQPFSLQDYLDYLPDQVVYDSDFEPGKPAPTEISRTRPEQPYCLTGISGWELPRFK
jgi:hypothetical protein